MRVPSNLLNSASSNFILPSHRRVQPSHQDPLKCLWGEQLILRNIKSCQYQLGFDRTSVAGTPRGTKLVNLQLWGWNPLRPGALKTFGWGCILNGERRTKTQAVGMACLRERQSSWMHLSRIALSLHNRVCSILIWIWIILNRTLIQTNRQQTCHCWQAWSSSLSLWWSWLPLNLHLSMTRG